MNDGIIVTIVYFIGLFICLGLIWLMGKHDQFDDGKIVCSNCLTKPEMNECISLAIMWPIVLFFVGGIACFIIPIFIMDRGSKLIMKGIRRIS